MESFAIDIGGANIRVGVVETRLNEHSALSKARIWKSHLWRHGGDCKSRKAAVAKLIDMLIKLINNMQKEHFL